MPPDSSAGISCARAAQADGVQLHQHEVADQVFGQLGVLAQRERDVLEHRHVGEQRAELEQHAHPPAQCGTAPSRSSSCTTCAVDARPSPLLRPQLAADQAQDRRLAAAASRP